MGLDVWMILSLFLPLLCAAPIDSEHDLPPYLQGIGWRKVERELRKDLRLTQLLRPMSYDIQLEVSVRGFRGAQRSTFDGSVVISLNSSSVTDKIELHSVGLNIKKAELTSSSSSINISNIEYNRERETVIFTLAETLQPTSHAQLKIYYNGTSQMRGIGLYESWTTNKEYSLPPTISLVTNCEPNGARRWFPSFDEPDKKAKFRLRIVHPTQLSVYSNTVGKTKELIGFVGQSETSFHQTVPLPTYVVALALTEQSAAEIRIIGTENTYYLDRLTETMDYVKNLSALQNIPFIPEKTDWLLVEDFPVGAMENPGLITSTYDATYSSIQLHELAHMYFGNLVTLRTWEQIWINEGFATFFQRYQTLFESYHYQSPSRGVLRQASIHDPAMHSEFSYSRSQFSYDRLIKNTKVHYDKASQLISLIKRFIGEKVFDCALNRYLVENSFGNGDSEKMIDYLSAEKPEARDILRDWVYQPGVAVLSVEREERRVIIRQRRFLRTDFNEGLRDKKTRWTIPLYYTVNGVEYVTVFRPEVEKLIVNFPSNSTLSIDDSYQHLYAVQYKDSIEKEKVLKQISTAKKSQSDRFEIAEENEYLDYFCKAYASGNSKEELWIKYLVENYSRYLLCGLKNRKDAERFLRDLLVSNELAIRNSDMGRITEMINNLHTGILFDLLTEEHQNIDFLDQGASKIIEKVAKQEPDGMEKLRNIVRVNPSFAANFYHMFTRIFEEDFIQREMLHFNPSIDDDFSYSYYY